MMKRKIIFSWFNGQPDLPFEKDMKSVNGQSAAGWSELVQFIAFHLGIGSEPENKNRRILAYMNGLEKTGHYLFFKALFQQDPLVTAGFVLDQRDELRWYIRDFKMFDFFSERLKNFAVIEENTIKKEMRGLPDIYWEVIDALQSETFIPLTILLSEDPELYPFYVNQLLTMLPACGVEIINPPAMVPSAAEGSNLYIFQRQLINLLKDTASDTEPFKSNDSSLRLFKTRYLTDATQELTGFLEKQEQAWYVLRHSSDIQVCEAMTSQKRILSAIKSNVESLPLTQVLKSFCNLIWKPFDIEAVYEFLNLPLKPFPKRLAENLANALLEAPGVRSTKWNEVLDQYWEKLNLTSEPGEKRVEKEQSQYNWWFEQTLFEPSQGIEMSEFIARIAWLREWAIGNARFQEEGKKNLFIELANLCLEINELSVIMVKQDKLIKTDLDKLLDLVLKNRSLQTQRFSRYASGIMQEITISKHIDNLIWSNFCGLWEEATAPDFLWHSEISELAKKGYVYFGRKEAARLMRYAMVRKVLSVKKELIFSYSSFHGTTANFPHSFWLFLKSLPRDHGVEHLLHHQICSETYVSVDPISFVKGTGTITVEGLDELLPRERESYSSISQLLYYPHLYLFEYVLGLNDRLASAFMLDSQLKGKIIHKFAEIALKDENLTSFNFDKVQWKNWCDANIPSFIEQEASLLNKSKYAAAKEVFKSQATQKLYNLLDAIYKGGWFVDGVEQPFKRNFNDHTLLNGRTDLILKKDGNLFIVDLKSGSSTYKETEIRENADWQLLLYSYFGHEDESTVLSSFFIIEKGEFIGRNNPGIAYFKVVKPKPNDEVRYENMLLNLRIGLQTRIDQIRGGTIEFRNSKEAIELLPDKIGEILMKETVNKFDNYLFLNTL